MIQIRDQASGGTSFTSFEKVHAHTQPRPGLFFPNGAITRLKVVRLSLMAQRRKEGRLEQE